ncbi:hypothetical protein CDL15_Pgr009725 [Punica granatum]|nr:hypothetical protein CDL15_Pgr009725 [Punica granatum]
MPAILKDSCSSAWLSVAADRRRMYVTEKVSGLTHSYHPEARAWYGPYYLRPDSSVYYSVIAFSGHRLILVGLIGSSENFESLKLWEVSSDLQDIDEIAEIPAELGEKLKDQYTGVPSITVRAAGNFVYMHSPERPENVVWCEVAARGGRSEWGWGRNAAIGEKNWLERMVFTCASVGVAELETAVAAGNRRFRVKETPSSI